MKSCAETRFAVKGSRFVQQRLTSPLISGPVQVRHRFSRWRGITASGEVGLVFTAIGMTDESDAVFRLSDIERVSIRHPALVCRLNNLAMG